MKNLIEKKSRRKLHSRPQEQPTQPKIEVILDNEDVDEATPAEEDAVIVQVEEKIFEEIHFPFQARPTCSVNVRLAAVLKSPVITVLNVDDEVTIDGEKDDWYHVAEFNGYTKKEYFKSI